MARQYAVLPDSIAWAVTLPSLLLRTGFVGVKQLGKPLLCDQYQKRAKRHLYIRRQSEDSNCHRLCGAGRLHRCKRCLAKRSGPDVLVHILGGWTTRRAPVMPCAELFSLG